ncbi:MAG: NAD(P)-dependent alcohol dehydrogenase [Anaerolineae bacterium]
MTVNAIPIHAYAAHAPKESLVNFDYAPAELGPHDVEIQISHCGICHSDIHIIDGDWGGSFPVVAGHEIVGTVTGRGALVTHIAIGQRVGVGWQSGSCMTCEWCVRGETNLCPNSVATCRGRYGGFADRIQTDSRFAFPIPEDMDSENAAPLLCAGITVYNPLRHFGVLSSSRVGVIGIGGLGHLGVQFANKFGCEVTAFSTSPDKEGEARGFGAHHFINSRDESALKQQRNSLDFILCTVNVNLDWNAYMRMLRPNGMLCFVGAMPGNFEVPHSAFSRQRSVRSGNIGDRDTMREMLEFAARHHVQAMTEAIPMPEVNAALDKVRQNQARYRMVLTN